MSFNRRCSAIAILGARSVALAQVEGQKAFEARANGTRFITASLNRVASAICNLPSRHPRRRDSYLSDLALDIETFILRL